MQLQSAVPYLPHLHGCVSKLSFLQPVVFIAENISAQYPRLFLYLGDYVKAKRLDLGLTQKEVGNILGTDDITVKNWERRYTKEPTLKFIPRIIEFLGYCPYTPCPTLPEKVVMWRKMKGISIQELADMVGIDQGTLVKYEKCRKISKPLQKLLEQQAENWGLIDGKNLTSF